MSTLPKDYKKRKRKPSEYLKISLKQRGGISPYTSSEHDDICRRSRTTTPSPISIVRENYVSVAKHRQITLPTKVNGKMKTISPRRERLKFSSKLSFQSNFDRETVRVWKISR